MIHFFRKIRQKLIAENSVRRYLMYAAGEILLVMFGILLALQINNWNENVSERKQEQAILRQLRIEFNNNLGQLDDKIRVKEDLITSVMALFNYIDKPALRNTDSLDYHLARTLPFSTFDPIENDLASSGELRLLQSDSLKLLLSLWTKDIKDVQEDELSWKFYRNEIYTPFLIEHYQLRTLRQVATQSGLLKQYLIESENPANSRSENDIGTTRYETDPDMIFSQPDFEDHLERAHTINRFALSQSLILRSRILEILELLDNQIE